MEEWLYKGNAYSSQAKKKKNSAWTKVTGIKDGANVGNAQTKAVSI